MEIWENELVFMPVRLVISGQRKGTKAMEAECEAGPLETGQLDKIVYRPKNFWALLALMAGAATGSSLANLVLYKELIHDYFQPLLLIIAAAIGGTWGLAEKYKQVVIILDKDSILVPATGLGWPTKKPKRILLDDIDLFHSKFRVFFPSTFYLKSGEKVKVYLCVFSPFQMVELRARISERTGISI
jgi:hypothetical protein